MKGTTKKDIQVCINPHFDAVSVWIANPGSEDSPCDISRGIHAAKRGVPRLIDLFERNGISKGITWSVTGHSMESFPKAAEMIVASGGEIAIHNYIHENPLVMTREQEGDVLDRTIEVVERLSGKRPRGYMAPVWDLSKNTIELLQERGFAYDCSLMEDDYHPHYLRVGDSYTKIDYSKNAREWMKPWVPGKEIDMVEIPCSWHLDDAPAVLFIKQWPNSHGWITGSQLEEMWMEQFDWVYRHFDYAVFPICVHPDASGHAHMLAALERMIDHMRKHEGVRFITMEEAAASFRTRCPFGSGIEVGGPSGL